MGFIFIALILLIMRISNLNEKIAIMDEQLSDFVTQEYLSELTQIQENKLSRKEMEDEVVKMNMNINRTQSK